MKRKICVIGVGYVGLVTAVGLAEFGHAVVAADVDREKIRKLRSGSPTIYEDQLPELLVRNTVAARLEFTNDLSEAINRSEIIFLTVGTPRNSDGTSDLSQIDAVTDVIGDVLALSDRTAMSDGHSEYNRTIIVTKSTVPVGTNRRISERLARRSPVSRFAVVSNPEFLREGTALRDFFRPDRIVFGRLDPDIDSDLLSLYRIPGKTPVIWCDWETAELIKYASNSFLATKLTFANQLSDLAEAIGADMSTVVAGMGHDRRINPGYMQPGPGYGGSCLPKDVDALIDSAARYSVDLSVLKSVRKANAERGVRMVEHLERMTGPIRGKTVCVLGLAFKAGTDDVRESPTLGIVRELVRRGADVRVHDPRAAENFRKSCWDSVHYSTNLYDALTDSDAIVVCTDWDEYESLDLDLAAELVRSRTILDLRGVFKREELERREFQYYRIGSGTRPDLSSLHADSEANTAFQTVEHARAQ